jgi:hypothetical protein
MKNAVFWETDVSEECVASIFRVEETTRGRKSVRVTQSVSNRLTLFFSRIISFALKMEATHSSETSVRIKPTWRHIPEDGILHILDLFSAVSQL